MPAALRKQRSGTATAQLGVTLLDLWNAEAAERTAPSEFRLFAKGINKSDQGDFLWDEEAEALVLKAFATRGRDLVIDYEHQSQVQPPIEAPAAGWFSLAARDGELWATNVKWVKKAQAQIEAGEYRYWSPTFRYDTKTGRVLEVFNNGLTNNPSLYGIPALVAASMRFNRNQEDEDMPTIEELTAKLTEMQGQLVSKDAEIAALKGSNQTAQLTSIVGLRSGAGGDELQTAITNLANFRAKVLSVTGKDSAEAALGTVEGWKSEAADAGRLKAEAESSAIASCKRQLGEILDQATKDGKIAPAQRNDWEKDAIEIGGGKPSEKAVTWLKSKVAVLVAQNSNTQTVTPPNGGEVVPGTQRAMLSNMNLPDDEFVKWKTERAAKGIGTTSGGVVRG